jgi:ribonuclease P protein component
MERLRQRADFLAAATGPRAPTEAFVLQTRRRDDQGPARFGFTVSRKVGTAVERNRARRRLKEMVKLATMERVKPGNDYVLVARRAALTRPFAQLVEDLDGALRRLSAANRRGKRPSAADGGADEVLR